MTYDTTLIIFSQYSHAQIMNHELSAVTMRSNIRKYVKNNKQTTILYININDVFYQMTVPTYTVADISQT